MTQSRFIKASIRLLSNVTHINIGNYNMTNSIWLAVGFLLITEGIGPLITPIGWRNMMAEMSKQPNNQLRRIGGCLVVSGLVIVTMIL